ncbi:restriction endonuclease subunit S [Mycoplasmopsis cynos]|uniref:restriction endonuclease subunit S n=1 Tax=Mycoplasmopsis cynos TaxID=171284 RepID=UPI0021FBD4A1|nr:restriction endonuclease subunit S [Mycoplasmopsis cynos]UWV77833.1 restriction endonuclease subunit S [Mycoplasmopsis cynos]
MIERITIKKLIETPQRGKTKRTSISNKAWISIFSRRSLLNYVSEGYSNNYDFNGKYLILTANNEEKLEIYYYQGKFSVSNDCLVARIKNNDLLKSKFIYYWLETKVTKMQTKVNFKNNLFKYVKNLNIPIMQANFQNDIINVLDGFNNLIYEKIKSLNNHKNLEFTKEIFTLQRLTKLLKPGEKIQTKKFFEVVICDQDFSNVALLKRPKIINYIKKNESKINEIKCDNSKVRFICKNDIFNIKENKLVNEVLNDSIIFFNINEQIDFKYYQGKFIPGDISIIKSVDNNFLRHKYLYLLLTTNKVNIISNYFDKKQNKLNLDIFMDFEIFIPPLRIQDLLIKTMEKYFPIHIDILKILPKEIEKLMNNYHNYRDLLFLFDNEK